MISFGVGLSEWMLSDTELVHTDALCRYFLETAGVCVNSQSDVWGLYGNLCCLWEELSTVLRHQSPRLVLTFQLDHTRIHTDAFLKCCCGVWSIAKENVALWKLSHEHCILKVISGVHLLRAICGTFSNYIWDSKIDWSCKNIAKRMVQKRASIFIVESNMILLLCSSAGKVLSQIHSSWEFWS